jgi:hypothetical protein
MDKHAFIIGAQRSGSSYLTRTLATSPTLQFAQPIFPEPKFFLLGSNFELGRDYYRRTFFPRPAADHVRIEKSTSYLESPEAAWRISDWFPDATIIVVLRNPIQRAISNYFFSKANGLERLGFEDALESEGRRLQEGNHTTSVSPFAYTRRGHYAECLRFWSARFPRSQIRILLFEDMVTSREPIAQLVEALGGDRDEIIFPPAHVNRGTYPSDNAVPQHLIERLQALFRNSVLELDEEWGIGAAQRWGF